MKRFIPFVIGVSLLSGCTSLGHSFRSKPVLSMAMDKVTEIGLVSDGNELSYAVESTLTKKGYKIVSPRNGTRYVVGVKSVTIWKEAGIDICIPEGSRQFISFNITVSDSLTNRPVFVINGDYGCKNTILANFEEWLPFAAKHIESNLTSAVVKDRDSAVDNQVDNIPNNWPQMYFYEIDGFKHWTVCGDIESSQTDAVISSKNKADQIFYSEFPKSKYGDVNYETTHMEIKSIGDRFKSWRIIRFPKEQ